MLAELPDPDDPDVVASPGRKMVLASFNVFALPAFSRALQSVQFIPMTVVPASVSGADERAVSSLGSRLVAGDPRAVRAC